MDNTNLTNVSPSAVWLSHLSITTSAVYVLIALAVLTVHSYMNRSQTKLPLINEKTLSIATSRQARLNYINQVKRLLLEGWNKFPDSCYRIIGDVDEVTILPMKYVNDIRNDKRYHFIKFVHEIFQPHLHGLEAFGIDSDLLIRVVQKDITKHLNNHTEPLREETTLALTRVFTDAEDWHEVNLRSAVSHLVAQVSSRIFQGTDLCRNEDWLRITRDYTITGVQAAESMRLWPSFLRPMLAWFDKDCQKGASLIAEARSIIGPIVERRRLEKQSDGYVPYDDAMEWFETAANGKEYDTAYAQLGLSVVAINTTTDLASQVLQDIAENPKYLDPLRKEVAQCIAEKGWTKAALYDMKLLDSCLRESLRMKPTSLLGMRRFLLEKATLPNGTVLPKGTLVSVPVQSLWDPSVYSEPEEWNGARFFQGRQIEGRENADQLISTSPEFLAFGHGLHSCPGRFFAASELKVVVANILLKYDWKLSEGSKPKIRYFGFAVGPDPSTNMLIRRRVEETS